MSEIIAIDLLSDTSKEIFVLTLSLCRCRVLDVIMVEEFYFLGPCKFKGLSAVFQHIHTVLLGIG